MSMGLFESNKSTIALILGHLRRNKERARGESKAQRVGWFNRRGIVWDGLNLRKKYLPGKILKNPKPINQ